MMNIVLKIVLFLTSNLLGSWMHAITFWILVATGLKDFAGDGALVQLYSVQVMGTWMICGLFSFSFFFLKNNWRYVFLLAPVVVPFCYGLILPALLY